MAQDIHDSKVAATYELHYWPTIPARAWSLEPGYPAIIALRSRIAARPGIAAYLASDRRIPFNEHGIFRHCPELDA